MALFCAAVRRDSDSLLKLPFLCHIQVFSCEMSLVCRLKCPYSCFLPIFVFNFFCSVDACVVSITSGRCNQSSSAFFKVVFESADFFHSYFEILTGILYNILKVGHIEYSSCRFIITPYYCFHRAIHS